MLESRDEITQISLDLVVLHTCGNLAVGVTRWISGVYAAYTRHVHPNLIICKTCDEDGSCYRDRVTFLPGLFDFLSETDHDERTTLELLSRHHIHVELLMAIHYRIAKLLDIDPSHAEHQGRRLHAAVSVALVALDACAESDISVSGAVDNCLGENRFTSFLAFDDNSFHIVALLYHIGAEDVEQYFNSHILKHFQCYILYFLRIDDGKADMILAWLVLGCLTSGAKPVDKHLRQTFHYLVPFSSEITEDRKPECQVSAYIAAAFYKHDF